MNNLVFRPATQSDLPTLLAFEQGVITAERPLNPTLKSEKITYYDIEELINRTDAVMIVGTINEEIITSGYARIKSAANHFKYDRYAYMGFMYVLSEYRGKGINRLLIKELTNWAKAQGVNEMRLDVYSDNSAAVRAYEKVGFKKLLVEMRLNLSDDNLKL